MFVKITVVILLQFAITFSKKKVFNKDLSTNELEEMNEDIDKGYCMKDYQQCDNGLERMVLIPKGEYQVGAGSDNDNEPPKKFVKLKAFYLDRYEVTNKEFNDFVTSTNRMTDAEYFGDSLVFELFLNSTVKDELKGYRAVEEEWWYTVLGADWRHPYGPDSNIADLTDHPVVHVSWRDAKAYSKWRGSRLPTEGEWEAACRGGHRDIKYPWGNQWYMGKQHMANLWQGTFPSQNTAKDGYIGTSPVNAFPPNDFGLYDMAGNVMEWTSSSWSENMDKNERVLKGGSYLSHASYSHHYRCSARSHQIQYNSNGNLGFRCAKSFK